MDDTRSQSGPVVAQRVMYDAAGNNFVMTYEHEDRLCVAVVMADSLEQVGSVVAKDGDASSSAASEPGSAPATVLGYTHAKRARVLVGVDERFAVCPVVDSVINLPSQVGDPALYAPAGTVTFSLAHRDAANMLLGVTPVETSTRFANDSLREQALAFLNTPSPASLGAAWKMLVFNGSSADLKRLVGNDVAHADGLAMATGTSSKNSSYYSEAYRLTTLSSFPDHMAPWMAQEGYYGSGLSAFCASCGYSVNLSSLNVDEWQVALPHSSTCQLETCNIPIDRSLAHKPASTQPRTVATGPVSPQAFYVIDAEGQISMYTTSASVLLSQTRARQWLMIQRAADRASASSSSSASFSSAQQQQKEEDMLAAAIAASLQEQSSQSKVSEFMGDTAGMSEDELLAQVMAMSLAEAEASSAKPAVTDDGTATDGADGADGSVSAEVETPAVPMFEVGLAVCVAADAALILKLPAGIEVETKADAEAPAGAAGAGNDDTENAPAAAEAEAESGLESDATPTAGSMMSSLFGGKTPTSDKASAGSAATTAFPAVDSESGLDSDATPTAGSMMSSLFGGTTPKFGKATAGMVAFPSKGSESDLDWDTTPTAGSMISSLFDSTAPSGKAKAETKGGEGFGEVNKIFDGIGFVLAMRSNTNSANNHAPVDALLYFSGKLDAANEGVARADEIIELDGKVTSVAASSNSSLVHVAIERNGSIFLRTYFMTLERLVFVGESALATGAPVVRLVPLLVGGDSSMQTFAADVFHELNKPSNDKKYGCEMLIALDNTGGVLAFEVTGGVVRSDESESGLVVPLAPANALGAAILCAASGTGIADVTYVPSAHVLALLRTDGSMRFLSTETKSVVAASASASASASEAATPTPTPTVSDTSALTVQALAGLGAALVSRPLSFEGDVHPVFTVRGAGFHTTSCLVATSTDAKQNSPVVARARLENPTILHSISLKLQFRKGIQASSPHADRMYKLVISEARSAYTSETSSSLRVEMEVNLKDLTAPSAAERVLTVPIMHAGPISSLHVSFTPIITDEELSAEAAAAAAAAAKDEAKDEAEAEAATAAASADKSETEGEAEETAAAADADAADADADGKSAPPPPPPMPTSGELPKTKIAPSKELANTVTGTAPKAKVKPDAPYALLTFWLEIRERVDAAPWAVDALPIVSESAALQAQLVQVLNMESAVPSRLEAAARILNNVLPTVAGQLSEAQIELLGSIELDKLLVNGVLSAPSEVVPSAATLLQLALAARAQAADVTDDELRETINSLVGEAVAALTARKTTLDGAKAVIRILQSNWDAFGPLAFSAAQNALCDLGRELAEAEAGDPARAQLSALHPEYNPGVLLNKHVAPLVVVDSALHSTAMANTVSNAFAPISILHSSTKQLHAAQLWDTYDITDSLTCIGSAKGASYSTKTIRFGDYNISSTVPFWVAFDLGTPTRLDLITLPNTSYVMGLSILGWNVDGGSTEALDAAHASAASGHIPAGATKLLGSSQLSADHTEVVEGPVVVRFLHFKWMASYHGTMSISGVYGVANVPAPGAPLEAQLTALAEREAAAAEAAAAAVAAQEQLREALSVATALTGEACDSDAAFNTQALYKSALAAVATRFCSHRLLLQIRRDVAAREDIAMCGSAEAWTEPPPALAESRGPLADTDAFECVHGKQLLAELFFLLMPANGVPLKTVEIRTGDDGSTKKVQKLAVAFEPSLDDAATIFEQFCMAGPVQVTKAAMTYLQAVVGAFMGDDFAPLPAMLLSRFFRHSSETDTRTRATAFPLVAALVSPSAVATLTTVIIKEIRELLVVSPLDLEFLGWSLLFLTDIVKRTSNAIKPAVADAVVSDKLLGLLSELLASPPVAADGSLVVIIAQLISSTASLLRASDVVMLFGESSFDELVSSVYSASMTADAWVASAVSDMMRALTSFEAGSGSGASSSSGSAAWADSGSLPWSKGLFAASASGSTPAPVHTGVGITLAPGNAYMGVEKILVKTPSSSPASSSSSSSAGGASSSDATVSDMVAKVVANLAPSTSPINLNGVASINYAELKALTAADAEKKASVADSDMGDGSGEATDKGDDDGEAAKTAAIAAAEAKATEAEEKLRVRELVVTRVAKLLAKPDELSASATSELLSIMSTAVDATVKGKARDGAYPSLSPENVGALAAFLQTQPPPAVYEFNLVLNMLATCSGDVLVGVAREVLPVALAHPGALAVMNSINAIVSALKTSAEALQALVDLVLALWPTVLEAPGTMLVFSSMVSTLQASISDGESEDKALTGVQVSTASVAALGDAVLDLICLAMSGYKISDEAGGIKATSAVQTHAAELAGALLGILAALVAHPAPETSSGVLLAAVDPVALGIVVSFVELRSARTLANKARDLMAFLGENAEAAQVAVAGCLQVLSSEKGARAMHLTQSTRTNAAPVAENVLAVMMSLIKSKEAANAFAELGGLDTLVSLVPGDASNKSASAAGAKTSISASQGDASAAVTGAALPTSSEFGLAVKQVSSGNSSSPSTGGDSTVRVVSGECSVISQSTGYAAYLVGTSSGTWSVPFGAGESEHYVTVKLPSAMLVRSVNVNVQPNGSSAFFAILELSMHESKRFEPVGVEVYNMGATPPTFNLPPSHRAKYLKLRVMMHPGAAAGMSLQITSLAIRAQNFAAADAADVDGAAGSGKARVAKLSMAGVMRYMAHVCAMSDSLFARLVSRDQATSLMQKLLEVCATPAGARSSALPVLLGLARHSLDLGLHFLEKTLSGSELTETHAEMVSMVCWSKDESSKVAYAYKWLASKLANASEARFSLAPFVGGLADALRVSGYVPEDVNAGAVVALTEWATSAGTSREDAVCAAKMVDAYAGILGTDVTMAAVESVARLGELPDEAVAAAAAEASSASAALDPRFHILEALVGAEERSAWMIANGVVTRIRDALKSALAGSHWAEAGRMAAVLSGLAMTSAGRAALVAPAGELYTVVVDGVVAGIKASDDVGNKGKGKEEAAVPVPLSSAEALGGLLKTISTNDGVEQQVLARTVVSALEGMGAGKPSAVLVALLGAAVLEDERFVVTASPEPLELAFRTSQRSLEPTEYFAGSKVINGRHAKMLNGWIKDRGVPGLKLPAAWRKRWDSSSGGATEFFDAIVGAGPFVFVISTPTEVFGGFCSVNVEAHNLQNQYFGDENCFLFNCTNSSVFLPTNAYNNQFLYSCSTGSAYFAFGGGHDLSYSFASTSSNYANMYTYQCAEAPGSKVTSQYNFTVVTAEVWMLGGPGSEPGADGASSAATKGMMARLKEKVASVPSGVVAAHVNPVFSAGGQTLLTALQGKEVPASCGFARIDGPTTAVLRKKTRVGHLVVPDSGPGVAELRYVERTSECRVVSRSEIDVRESPFVRLPQAVNAFASAGGLGQLLQMVAASYNGVEPSRASGKLTSSALTELQLLLDVPGYAGAFLASPACMHLVFKSMGVAIPRYLAGVEAAAKKVAEAKASSGTSAADGPSPTDKAKDMFLDVLSSLLTISSDVEMRQSLISNGVLGAVLARISELTSTEPRRLTAEQQAAKDKADAERKAKLEREREKNADKQEYWAKGTGYGTGSTAETAWDQSKYAEEMAERERRVGLLLDTVTGCVLAKSVPDSLFTLLEGSCLVPFVGSYLRNDSLLDMAKHKSIYLALMRLVEALCSHDVTLALFDDLEGEATSVFALLKKLHSCASMFLKTVNKIEGNSEKGKRNGKEPAAEEAADADPKAEPAAADDGAETESDDEAESEDGEAAGAGRGIGLGDETAASQDAGKAVAAAIMSTFKVCSARMKEFTKAKKGGGDGAAVAASSGKGKEAAEGEGEDDARKIELYMQFMEDQQFDEMDMQDSGGYSKHHYASSISSSGGDVKSKMMRLAQEASGISGSLPLSFDSSVFVRIDEERMDVWKAMIIGPEGTPYENGCFEFHIFFPDAYPKSPPLVNMETNANGTQRFNPNLYANGKVCLSLLGTWDGDASEMWNEATSTFLQVLVSIQSLIMVPEPYFNEPGYESSRGTPSGDAENLSYTLNIYTYTLQTAILGQLRNPPKGFEDVIRAHLYMKRKEILAMAARWKSCAAGAQNSNYLSKIEKFETEIRAEFEAMTPPELLSEELEMEDNELEQVFAL
ncbi:ubiquitin-conjugating enzyme family protein [Thecamonas trahens ATCC 50062]|uniref:Ubiquitin-conjugating enzyme family protein n=1 Tax=Thecamonas trahens ATCC 50062 TaxID=461836 RepID=A0A0L0D5I5_THETB|nr:ubiquitin-conjugating enzyme family protein [Thecamonas trahens ATCC 50062]KNC47475.1 ubiquitin-conjugating enzyme family protein [Thecamonas trahens ATCC 50062]|eukprot:XP_013759411.1 ubiquitin-conjugating enzyme family protein [Thecamonas trahens ATCC 50062]